MSKGLNLPFYQIFSDCRPNGELGRILEQGIVRDMVIDSERRELRLTLFFSTVGAQPPEERLAELKAALSAAYDLSGVVLSLEQTEPETSAEEEREDEEAEPLPQEDCFSEPADHCCDEEDGDAIYRRTEEIRKAALRDMNLSMPAKKDGKKKADGKEGGKALLGKTVKKEAVPMHEVSLDSGQVLVRGRVFAVNHRELKKRGAWVISFDMTDYTGAVRVSKFMPGAEASGLAIAIEPGKYLAVEGRPMFNRFENELTLEPVNIFPYEAPVRKETAEEKRVELHLHTRMSAMDGLTETKEAVLRAASWGHRAIAITDHGVVQSFPDAAKAAKGKEIKILYGTEAYLLDDLDESTAVRGALDAGFDGEFVCFDLETTGLYPSSDKITEIGAVILKDGKVTERFETFAAPGQLVSQQITELTGITNEMLVGAPSQEEALRAFLDFAGGRILVAHNADFDIGFLEEGCRLAEIPFSSTNIDTLTLSRNLLPNLPRHKLDLVAGHLGLPAFRHHRASDDAETAALLLARFFEMLKESRSCTRVQEINRCFFKTGGESKSKRGTRHLIILAKNQTGLRNLYKLVTFAHLKYFKRHPVIPKSVLNENREGLILGSACESGELFSAVAARKSWSELLRIAAWYDYLEIQPVCNNAFMIRKGTVKDEDGLREMNRTIVRLGKQLGKPVCATGDVHFLEPEDEIYRHILLAGQKFEDADEPLPLYLKTTDEMLQEFSYLGADGAREVVVTNPNLVADWCDPIAPLPKGLYPPRLKGSAEELEQIVWSKAKELYGDNPPQLVIDRIQAELKDIIGCKYDVIYMSAQKLVSKSLENGYLVGSRGSVGSSLVAFLSGITEVNSLPPHFRCPKCRHSEFITDSEYGCGADMPDRLCPVCGTQYEKDGFDIPFETFLGFGGDKVPDIDLNFSGEYQAQSHRDTVELFGQRHVFRAGTIGTVADKTAYGFVKKYLEERGKVVSRAEENRLTAGCVGVKRTTGQHPGGLVVVPDDMEIYDFCPAQRPADDPDSDIVTTHFEYHSMEDNLLKLDLLGHDDPSMLRMLGDLTGVDVRRIPLDDPETMSIFTSSKVLGFEDDPILGPTGACAIPEFGTPFVREMLLSTKPHQMDELVRISGFSHGTDVWLGNAKDLISSGTGALREVIGCRDDIMLYLIRCGLDEKFAFKIMETVRKKNKTLSPDMEEAMRAVKVPEWYIGSCNKIQYLFPKAHAVAYVMMALRIAWFKVHRPLAFYAAYFTIRAKAVDAAFMTCGMDTVMRKMKEIERKEKEATAVEQDMVVTLEVCYEFYLRGFSFQPVDLYRSDATKFLIDGNGLIPPFVAVSGLGETAARDLTERREGKRFVSVEEISATCPKISKGHIEQLRALGALTGLPDTSQLTLF